MAQGNHETFPDNTDYVNRFLMPNKESTNNYYYSWDINNIHFVSITTSIIDHPDPNPFDADFINTMINWLKNDLANVPANVWKIIYTHRPLYCSANIGHCKRQAELMRNYFEQIFIDNKVDLIVSGHVHDYERGYPTANGKVDLMSVSNNNSTYTNPQYPVYLICGAGGGAENIIRSKL